MLIDVERLHDDDPIWTLAMNFPCFDSEVDKTVFLAGKNDDPLAPAMLANNRFWLCNLENKYIITTFSHKMQDRKKIEMDLSMIEKLSQKTQ